MVGWSEDENRRALKLPTLYTILSPITCPICSCFHTFDFLVLIKPEPPPSPVSYMFDVYDPMSGCLRRKSCNSQWEGAEQEVSDTSLDFTHILCLLSCFLVQKTTPARAVGCVSCSREVTFDHARICEISSWWGTVGSAYACRYLMGQTELDEICWNYAQVWIEFVQI